jgi:branched-chain amino acid transport system ATP-binding protein
MNECVLEAIRICAGYGSVSAVTDVDLRVERGEMVALLGANGAGKTTTLLTLAGAVRPSSGTVQLYGEGADRRSLSRRARDGLALLPDQRAVFRGLTVRENLRLGRGDVRAALEFFPELEARLSVRAGLISGGEQQMLALARVLAARPRLILADELSLGLAPLVVRRLLIALSGVARDGAAVLLVEQHPHTALRWTDRAYVMRRGRIELSGKSDELLNRADDLAAIYL